MVRFSKSSWVLLGAIGTLWYATLVILIVSLTDFPGSALFRNYSMMIGVVFVLLTGCFRQTYVVKKREVLPDED